MTEIIELIKSIPAPYWTIFCTAFGTLIITLISVSQTNKGQLERLRIQFEYDKKIKEDELMRTRLEELFKTLIVIDRDYRGIVFQIDMELRGEKTYNIENIPDLPPLAKIEMIVNLYFHVLKVPYNEFVIEKESFGKLMIDPIRIGKSKATPEIQLVYFTKVVDNYKRIDVKIEHLKKCICELIKS